MMDNQSNGSHKRRETSHLNELDLPMNTVNELHTEEMMSSGRGFELS